MSTIEIALQEEIKLREGNCEERIKMMELAGKPVVVTAGCADSL